MFPPQSSFLSSFPISSSSNFHSFRVLHITYPSSCHDLLLLSSLLILIRCGDVQLEGVERTCRGMDAPCQYYWSVIISFESFHPAMLCHVVLYYNISYIIVSNSIVSHHIMTHYITTYHILPHRIISLTILSCPALSCFILFYPVLSSPVLSCPVLSSSILSCFILFYPLLFYAISSFSIPPYCIISCPIP